jgi:hypothetical protein
VLRLVATAAQNAGGTSGGTDKAPAAEDVVNPALDRDVAGEMLGQIRADALVYAASGSAGGTTRVFDDDFVAEPTISSPVFTKLRRAGYEIRTRDLQLGKLTLYR